MTMDIERLVGAVSRELTTREHEGRPARVLVASRLYDTTIEDLWDALTTAERLQRWFSPISGDLRLGGRYQLEGNAGGEITACEPPRAGAACRGPDRDRNRRVFRCGGDICQYRPRGRGSCRACRRRAARGARSSRLTR